MLQPLIKIVFNKSYEYLQYENLIVPTFLKHTFWQFLSYSVIGNSVMCNAQFLCNIKLHLEGRVCNESHFSLWEYHDFLFHRTKKKNESK